jgi:kanamycin kinase
VIKICVDGEGPAPDREGVFDDPPAAVLRAIGGRGWEPVTHGFSDAGVWRLDGPRPRFLKVGAGATDEAARTVWLATAGLPAPAVLDAGSDGSVEWLVTAAVIGRPAHLPWPVDRRGVVVDALARITVALHALPVAECPFDRSLAVTLPVARAAGLAATAPAVEELAVCHGDLCLPNVLLDETGTTVTGLVDLGLLGRADRHTDLALMSRSLADPSLNPQYGPERAAAYVQACGEAVDPDRLAFYRLLDEFA